MANLMKTASRSDTPTNVNKARLQERQSIVASIACINVPALV